jgi:chorismate dehydratase
MGLLMGLCREPAVPEKSQPAGQNALRIGAVTYLNSKPLIWCLPGLAPQAQVVLDLPSRLADGLAAARLDVALVPSIEYFRIPGCTVVSDACISCDGRVKSVKLFSRVPLRRIRTLALDEGSRTSAAMVRIMLRERYKLEPELQGLPIGTSLGESAADAVLLIGDRAMRPAVEGFEEVWDLGQEWSRWTGLPFVFAMWVARPCVHLRGMDELLGAARDQGLCHLEEIARDAASALDIPEAECLAYLRDNLVFELGRRQRLGLETFYQLAVTHGLAPPGMDLVFYNRRPA